MPRLIVRRKSEVLAEYILQKPSVSIGSATVNDVVLQDPLVSTQHCEIRKAGEVFEIHDSKSAYGTNVNGQKVRSQNLAWEDRITLGSLELIFRPARGEAEKEAERLFLLGIHGACFGKKFELKPGENRIGRDEEHNDIVLPGDPSVSRRHATISYHEGAWVLSDKRSRNRTFLGQKQLSETESLPLSENDEILIGHSIFRVVKEGSNDYSPPKKAGLFWVRRKTELLRALRVAVFGGSLFSLYSGAYGLFVLSSVPGKLSFWPVTWNPEIRQEDAAPPVSDGPSFARTPAMGDLNGDGKPDVVYATALGNVYAWNGSDGSFLWNAMPDLGTRVTRSPALADFNSDGALDIVFATDDSRLLLIDGASGAIVAKSAILGGALSAPAVADLDGDGLLDVVAGSEEGALHFYYAPAGQGQLVSVAVKEPIVGAPSVFFQDGHAYAIAGTLEGKLIIADGATRQFQTVDVTEAANKFLGTHSPRTPIASTPVAQDINGDGDTDIVVVTQDSVVAALDAKTRDVHWVYHGSEASSPDETETPPTEIRETGSPALADADGDGEADVWTVLPNGKAVALKGSNGRVFWEQIISRTGGSGVSPALTDLTKDGCPEMIFGTETGNLVILHGTPNRIAPEERVLFKERVGNAPLIASPVVGDITGDGYPDILAATTADDIKVFSSPSRRFKKQLLWPMLGHDAMRSGYLSLRRDYWTYGGRALAGALVFAAALFLQHRSSLREKRLKPRLMKVTA